MHKVPLRLLALCALAACGGDKPEDDEDITPIDPIEPPPVDSVHTGLDGSYVDAAFFAVIGAFAYDQGNQRFASFAHPDVGLVPMSLTVLLIDSSLTKTGVIDESNSCSVTLEFDGPRDNAVWAESHGQWAGVDVPSDATVRDTCQFYGLPSNFEGDAASHVTKWAWGMGIGPLSEVTRQQLSKSLPASEWAALEPYAVGASLNSDFFVGSVSKDGFFGDGLGLGYEVDGNFQIIVGGTGNYQPIPNEQVEGTKGGIATGYYESEFLFQPGTALTNPVP